MGQCQGCASRGIKSADNSMDNNYESNIAKLPATNWLDDSIYDNNHNIVEVRFKNTTKRFYRNLSKNSLKAGDVVAVSSKSGHDIGTVSLTGKLVMMQMHKKQEKTEIEHLPIVYRVANSQDKKTWQESIKKEHSTLLKTRQIITDLGLDMKLSDVEYQGDMTRAIFYYIAEGRVDFRQLIKDLATEFSVKVEMKQIGARQESARVGGIGSCGRELCCSSWKTGFESIGLNAAKTQDLSPNAQRMVGQCGKLKCCLMYELDNYAEAQESIPKTLLELETEKGTAFHQKTDVLKKIMYYSYKSDSSDHLIPIPVDIVKKIIADNKKGVKPSLSHYEETQIEIKDLEFTMNDPSSLTEKKPLRNNSKKKKSRKKQYRPKKQNK